SPVVELRDIMNSRDMIALDARRRPRLANEARECIGVACVLRQYELDGVALRELDMGDGQDDAHPSDPEDAIDAIAPVDHLPDAGDGLADGGGWLGDRDGVRLGDRILDRCGLPSTFRHE